MVDLTMLLEAIIAVITLLLTVFVIPWLRSKTTEQQRTTMLGWIAANADMSESCPKESSSPSRSPASHRNPW